MRKLGLILAILMICSPVFAADLAEIGIVEKPKDYWVYVRLEDRSGVTAEDDAGRSKAGDVVAILPINDKHIPSATEKKEWMIYKTSLTESKRQEMIETWEEEVNEEKITKAYRKNKLDTSKLGVDIKKGLVENKIDASKIDYQVKTLDDLAKYESKRKFYAYVQRPVTILYGYVKYAFDYWTKPAYAFSTTTCSDNDTEDREQICTINKTGEDYNTLSLWEDAKDGDLVTDKQIRTAAVYDDDGTLVDSPIIDGSTTSASYYMKVTSPVAERHDGTSGSGAYINNTGRDYTIDIRDNYTIIEWLELSKNSTHNRGVLFITAADETTIRNNIVRDSFDTDGGGVQQGILIVTNQMESGYTTYIYDNFVYNLDGGGITTRSYDDIINYVYNNTVLNCGGTGLQSRAAGATDYYVNNISMGNESADYADTAGNVFTNNISEDTTGNVGLQEKVIGDQFVNSTAGSEDAHLKTGSDAIDAGDDLGTTPLGVEIDIDGRDRDAEGDTWDIGADEYVASATGRTRRFF